MMITNRSVWRFLLCVAVALAWQFWSSTGTARADDNFFYVAPKVVFGQQKADFGAPSYEIRGVEGYRYQPKYPGTFAGKGLSVKDSLTFGALAFGLDLHDRFHLPLRLELEISTRADAKTQGETLTYPADPNQPDSDKINLYTKSLAYTMHTAFANVYLDWHNSSALTPYVGGGVGAAFIKARATAYHYSKFHMIDTEDPSAFVASGGGDTSNNSDFKKRKAQFAWHFDVGFSYDLTEKMAIDLSYRYLDIGDALKVGKPLITQDRYDVVHHYDSIYTPPSEVNFEATHQVVLGLRYSF